MSSKATEPNEIASEQAYFDYAYELRETKRDARTQAALSAGDSKARSALKRNAESDATLGSAKDPVAFVRIDTAQASTYYVGNNTVRDVSGDILVYNWKVPAVMRLREATPTEPGEVARQRSFTTAPVNKVLNFDDLVFAEIAEKLELLEGDDAALAFTSNDALLLDELDRARGTDMGQIVQTIQAAQSKLIRQPANQLTIIQGGPGTGKTAVALHRVAWLLYNNRNQSAEDILVIGPNRTFSRYIQRVVAELGHDDVRNTDLDSMLAAGVEANVKESAKAAQIKGEIVMRDVLKRALRGRITAGHRNEIVPSKVPGVRAIIQSSEMADLAQRYRKAPYNAGRTQFSAAVTNLLVERANSTAISATARHAHLSVEQLFSKSTLDLLIDRTWPSLTPHAFLRDFYASREYITAAAADLLEPGQARLLYRPPTRRLGEQPWSREDRVLLDFANHLINGAGGRWWHIVVDEAQDLSSMQIDALRRRSLGGAMTLVGDIAQSTGRWARNSWAPVIDVLSSPLASKIETLDFGYRVPRRVMAVAAPLLPHIAPGTPPLKVIRDVEQSPVFTPCSPGALSQTAVDSVQGFAGLGLFTGIICPDSRREDLEHALREVDVTFTNADQGQLGTSVNIVSPVAAKGLEFDAVVVIDPQAIVAAGPEGLRMLYIALTRTTRRLALVYPAGSLPTEIEGPWVPREVVETADDSPVATIETVESIVTAFDSEASVNASQATGANSSGRVTPLNIAERHHDILAITPPSTPAHSIAQTVKPHQLAAVELQVNNILELLGETLPRQLWAVTIEATMQRLSNDGDIP